MVQGRSSAIIGWLVLALLFGAALFLRLYRLDAQPLWLDEGTTWAQVTGSRLSTLLIDLFRPSQAYPLFHLLLKIDTRLLGDGEWALRLPSALAGALAVPAIALLGRELRGWTLGIAAALLLLVSPFGIWQSQDVKAYSLTLLTAILLGWTLTRAIRKGTRRRWLIFAAVALIAPFVHRLLVFTLFGCALAWSLTSTHRWRRWVLAGAIAGGLGLVAALYFSLEYQNASGQFAAVGPIRAVWLTFGQFATGQWPGAVRRLWLLPFGLLTLAGALRLLFDLRRGERHGAIVVLALGAFPALLFALLLTVQEAFEVRYLTTVFPFWLLALGWSLPESRDWQLRRALSDLLPLGSLLLFFIALITSYQALYLRDKGLFSGSIVKEDYRGAIGELAQHVHPDDLVMVYPDTILPLYRYYAPRMSQQPLPEPVSYPELGRAEGFNVKEFEPKILADLASRKRAWLIIAPDHARIIDKPAAGDELGLVGLAFQYGDLNDRLQCGAPPYAGYVGVRLYCNNIPNFPSSIQNSVTARFGDALNLRGYTLTPFETGIRPGGTLPLSLFWETLRSLEGTDYQVFVHLTTPDDPKPLAQIDGRPMEGGQPTTLWNAPGLQFHDDRTMPLPATLPPGRYVLRLGVYRPEDGVRLPVTNTRQPVDSDSVVLGEVEVQAADSSGGR
ncbi:MAG: glycosyltransferase family 39 protein [Chloroflexi bacterium]|nr:glycosyltransferase family 39 protein [Chloroflexota bacterium]